jgi:hypothetical protein
VAFLFFLRPAKKGRDMPRLTLYLPAMLVGVLVAGGVAWAAAVLVASKETNTAFPDTAFAGKNGKIAYQDRYGVIYTINPDGSGKTKVTDICVAPTAGGYSPTGKKITYEDCEGKPRH